MNIVTGPGRGRRRGARREHARRQSRLHGRHRHRPHDRDGRDGQSQESLARARRKKSRTSFLPTRISKPPSMARFSRAFANQGEVCSAGSRLLVQKEIHKPLVQGMLKKIPQHQTRPRPQRRREDGTARFGRSSRESRKLHQDRPRRRRDACLRRKAARGQRVRKRKFPRAHDLRQREAHDADREGRNLRAGAFGDSVSTPKKTRSASPTTPSTALPRASGPKA